jgi:RHS repeat-associated protein
MAGAWGELGIWNYTYGAGNERVEALGPADGSRRVYFYDVTGELLGEYSVLVDGEGKLYPKQERMRVSFAGRPLEWEDRLGSKVIGPIDQQTGQATRYRYYPYGQNIGTNVGWDDVQFATYTRDGATGLDYARNRYYTRTWGRFLSPDPYVASGGPADPGSWNRYAYVQGDPVNFNDPGGLLPAVPGCGALPFGSAGGTIDTWTNCPAGQYEIYYPLGQSQSPLMALARVVTTLENFAQDIAPDPTGHGYNVSLDIEDYLYATSFAGQASDVMRLPMPPQIKLPVVVVTLTWVGLNLLYDWYIHRQSRTPVRGAPNTTEEIPTPGGKTVRKYGPDGRAAKDIDYGHDHGGGDPHVHDWDWSKNPPRQPGRPPVPGEI